ncbi:MAG: tRNA (adenosine(37)-N6)-dimethylallyltransferase MiaA [Micrococcales bacterium]|nr:tRNA (adenosine(37)-N6)-dimethylallyltransferase MiaA [Micrococcales bacterium]
MTRCRSAGQLIAVVGPTATGKSTLGLDLAQQLGGEIVGADAMALYRGMDIGTAKTPLAKRRGIPHHQIDVLEVTEEASVAAYQRQARASIEGIWQRGKAAVVVGGSGLYIRALLDQIDFPGTDPQVRARWEEYAVQHGVEGLYQELHRQDPAAAAAIEPNNTRRLIRALEVIELTGQAFQAKLPVAKSWRPVSFIGLDKPGSELDQAIDQRVAQMWQDGLLEEVQTLVNRGLRLGRTASRAIGYRECLQLLDGEISEAEAITGIAQATRQLARRQRKWFRRDDRINWLEPSGDTLALALDLIDPGRG